MHLVVMDVRRNGTWTRKRAIGRSRRHIDGENCPRYAYASS
jgi:hypothetical protein